MSVRGVLWALGAPKDHLGALGGPGGPLGPPEGPHGTRDSGTPWGLTRPQGKCVTFSHTFFTFLGTPQKPDGGRSIYFTFSHFFAFPSAQIHNSTTNSSPQLTAHSFHIFNKFISHFLTFHIYFKFYSHLFHMFYTFHIYLTLFTFFHIYFTLLGSSDGRSVSVHIFSHFINIYFTFFSHVIFFHILPHIF